MPPVSSLPSVGRGILACREEGQRVARFGELRRLELGVSNFGQP